MSIHKKEILKRPEELTFPIPVVVDTNVLIGGLSGESPAAQTIVELLNEGNCRLVSTRGIRGEFHAISTGLRLGKNRWTATIMPKEDRRLIEQFFWEGIDVSREKSRKLTRRLPTGDQDDAKFVIAARKSECACIISNDYHLRELQNYEGFEDITVLTPEEFLEKFGFTS